MTDQIEDIYELTPMQEGMLFHTLYEGGRGLYIEQGVWSLEGRLEVQQLQQAWAGLLERHAILRTAVYWEEVEKPLQVVYREVKLPWLELDMRGVDAEEQQRKIEDFLRADGEEQFNLNAPPLLRCSLLRRGETSYLFVFTHHHMILDGWSMPILLKEVLLRYEAACEKRRLSLAPVASFRDYVLWLQEQDESAIAAFWKDYLGGYEGMPWLPTAPGLSSNDMTTPEVREELYLFRPEQSAALEAFSRQHQLTMNTLLQGAWALLLSRYTGVEDVVFGMTVSGRTAPLEGVEEMVGLCINTLPVRVQVDGMSAVAPWLKGLQENVSRVRQYEYTPLARLREWVELDSERPLFQTLLAFDNYPTERLLEAQPQGLELSKRSTSERSNYPLALVAHPGERLRIKLVYDREGFELAMIQRMAGHLERLLLGLIESPQSKLKDVPILQAEEWREMLVTWNRTERDYPLESTLAREVERQALATPEAPALHFEGESLCYGALNQRANQWAHYLRRSGVGRDDVVAVCLERSLELPVVLLGILKAGAAYAPLDTEAPQERFKFLLEDSGARVVISNEAQIKRYPYAMLRGVADLGKTVHCTAERPRIEVLDSLPFPDHNLIDHSRYDDRIGLGCVKQCISIFSTRGCPYQCLYCHKLWPKQHKARSAENLFEEVRMHYDRGYRSFTFIDDIFNLDRKNSAKFFELILKHNMKLRLLFASGLRGDILTPEYIDLMAEAGVIQMTLALESASPRIQGLIRKNLKLDRLKENLLYTARKHPQIILDLFMMYGFPTETKAEAQMTVDFVSDIHWLHFPYLLGLKIYPRTAMAELAIEHGISRELIEQAPPKAYHEPSDTLPYSKGFARNLQAAFLNDYFLNPARLEAVIPQQKKSLSVDELIDKYNSYLPGGLENYPQLEGLIRAEGAGYVRNAQAEKERACWLASRVEAAPKEASLRVLLLDLTQLFSADADSLYNVVEAPLGLMYLLSYLTAQYQDAVAGKILKSHIDFDCYEDLKRDIAAYQPDLIGIRSLTLFRDFFHKTVAFIRLFFPAIPIVAGGPYASSSYRSMLSDPHVDLAVLGEGEVTFAELIGTMLRNGGAFPTEKQLATIPGLAYIPKAQREDRIRTVLLSDQVAALLDAEDKSNPPALNSPDDVAYVIYTSGSTGQPKGAMIPHRAILNRIWWMQEVYPLNAEDKVLQKTPYTFDVSVVEFFWPLMTGAQLVLARPGGHRDSAYLAEVISREKITNVDFVPSMLAVFLEEPDAARCENLKWVTCGGEALSADLLQRYQEHFTAPLRNMYGPTETTVAATSWLATPKQEQVIPIGRPIANVQCYVLDAYLQPTPIYVPGELYLGGVQLAQGYLGRPELTAERFIKHPFSSTPGARLYRTGDLVRYLADGTLEFLGRSDHQVKIRGFRIELAEIESVLKQHYSLREAVVLAQEEEGGGKRLAAYCVASGKGEVETEVLRDFLGQRLPDYMIPAVFLCLPSLPLLSSGKVDLKALPLAAGGESKADFVAPRGPVEEKIALFWRELLGLDQVGIEDNFFYLGGHSLKATQLIARLREAFSVQIGLRDFLEKPTISALAHALEAAVAIKTEEEVIERLDRGESEEAMLAQLEEMGEAEKEALLAELLEEEVN